MIPAARYSARAVDAKMGRTQTGKEQVAVLFEILEPPEQTGQQITWYGYFTEKTVERTLESLEHCGWNGKGFDGPNLSTVRGECQIVINHEADQEGNMRARVQWVNASGGIAIAEELDEGSVQALNQRLKGAMLARQQNRGQRQKAKPKGKQYDDDFGPTDYGDEPPL